MDKYACLIYDGRNFEFIIIEGDRFLGDTGKMIEDLKIGEVYHIGGNKYVIFIINKVKTNHKFTIWTRISYLL